MIGLVSFYRALRVVENKCFEVHFDAHYARRYSFHTRARKTKARKRLFDLLPALCAAHRRVRAPARIAYARAAAGIRA